MLFRVYLALLRVTDHVAVQLGLEVGNDVLGTHAIGSAGEALALDECSIPRTGFTSPKQLGALSGHRHI